MQDSIVTSATTISTSQSIIETTRLWHMWLGHMSKRRLTILSKRGLFDGQKVGELIISIWIFGALLKLYHMVVEDICWPLLRITLERSGYISWNIRMMSLGSSRNGKSWSRSRLENRSSAWELTMAWNSMGKSLMSFARMKVLWDTAQLDILHSKMVLQNIWIFELF